MGSLIGLLGGPVGMVAGAAVGTLTGAVRDFWAAGVGLDFVEEAAAQLKPGKVALVAEIEEDWVIPVDSAMEAAGGAVLRRARSDMLQVQCEHDIATLKAEIPQLEAESNQATEAAKIKLKTKLDAAKASLNTRLQQANDKAAKWKAETDAKITALERQIEKA